MAGAKFRHWQGVETGAGTAVVRVPLPLAEAINELRDSGADVRRVVRALKSVSQSAGDSSWAAAGLPPALAVEPLPKPDAGIEGGTDKPDDRAALLALAASRVAAGETVKAVAEDFNRRGWTPAAYPGVRKGAALMAQAWTIKTLYQAIQRAAGRD